VFSLLLQQFGGPTMNSCTEACAQVRCVVADLVRIAQSDLAPPDKLELLCTQIGTAQHLLAELLPDEAAATVAT
jgi:hypothetical protein